MRAVATNASKRSLGLSTARAHGIFGLGRSTLTEKTWPYWHQFSSDACTESMRAHLSQLQMPCTACARNKWQLNKISRSNELGQQLSCSGTYWTLPPPVNKQWSITAHYSGVEHCYKYRTGTVTGLEQCRGHVYSNPQPALNHRFNPKPSTLLSQSLPELEVQEEGRHEGKHSIVSDTCNLSTGSRLCLGFMG